MALDGRACRQASQCARVIAMPLRGRKGTHGVIEIFNPRADQMTDSDHRLPHILAITPPSPLRMRATWHAFSS